MWSSSSRSPPPGTTSRLVHTPEYLEQAQDRRIRARGARAARGAVVAGGRRGLPAHDRRHHPGRAAGRQPAASAAVCHIGGGFHHAFANHGEGFCLFNDVAVAIRRAAARAARSRGPPSSISTCITATAPRSSSRTIPRVFTFSMHQQHNYPAFKPRGIARRRAARRHGRRHVSRTAGVRA